MDCNIFVNFYEYKLLFSGVSKPSPLGRVPPKEVGEECPKGIVILAG